jgi:hypothetical protein
VNEIDFQALKIVSAVQEAHASLVQEIEDESSIFLVFAHDLVIHFSSILMHRQALREYSGDVKFPYVNKIYAQSPFPVDFETATNINVSIKGKLFLRRLALSHVALGEAIPLGFGTEKIWAKWLNFLASYQPFTKVFLPRKDWQIDALKSLVDFLCKMFDISNSKIIMSNWESYVALHTMSAQPVIHQKGLIVGTRNHLQNRKLAANYLQQGLDVVAITHGEVSNAVMDEPPFGYSERTLCSTLVEYGTFIDSGKYNAPWNAPKQTFYRTGSLAEKVHRPADDIVFPEKNSSGLYIPTTYHGNNLYGPFHAFEDASYQAWQKKLFTAIPGLTFKAHPKSQSKPLEGVRVDSRPLEKIINQYDFLVFDYFATGAMLALMSCKPVLYCDIGLRNLHPDFLEDLKKRCEYVKIDYADQCSVELAEMIQNQCNQGVVRTNQMMKRYVFCDESKFNLGSIFLALNAGRKINS